MADACQGTTKAGQQCKAPPMLGSTWCFFHHPARADARAAARRKGGQAAVKRAAVLPPDSPDAPLKTSADVAVFLGATVNRVCRGELDAKVGNCVAVLCGQLLRAIEGGELAARVAPTNAGASRSDEQMETGIAYILQRAMARADAAAPPPEQPLGQEKEAPASQEPCQSAPGPTSSESPP
jgi:hypothetical protein